MASPLLESGAIDGAKGILINITGSSNLKLNEVFEASTIIQNAAHEDANIIFGAVQDESMGDDVKITVIATGFKDEMPQRRERMLQGAALPASRVEAPAPPPPPRITQRPAATPAPFASEVQAPVEEREAPVQEKPALRKKSRESVMSVVPEREPVAVQPPPPPAPAPVTRTEEPLRITPVESPRATASEPLRMTPSEPVRVPNEPLRITPPREPEPTHGAYVPAASAEPKPELVPVPASVFDDDFFRKSNEELRPGPESRSWETSRETRDNREESPRETESVASPPQKTHWPEARVPSFAGYAGGGSSSSEEDELDIPAFLRRSR
jgi:cell division protein FtsZ